MRDVLTRAIFVAVIASAGSAVADDHKHEADEHARRGVALYKLGKYAEAIDEFEVAYVLYPSDTLLYNLGQSHRQLDHCREAIDYYHRFLDGQPDSPLAPKVSELIPPLEHACEVKYKKPVDVDTGAPVSTQKGAPTLEPRPTLESIEPDAAHETPLRVRGGVGAGVLVSGGATATPIGPDVMVTHEIANGALELGGQLAAGWFPGAPGTTATAVTGRAIALRTVWRGYVDVAVGGGIGVLLVTNPTRSMTRVSGAVTMPELAGLASVERALGDGWEASLDIEAAAGVSSDVNGGEAVTLGVSLAVGIRR